MMMGACSCCRIAAGGCLNLCFDISWSSTTRCDFSIDFFCEYDEQLTLTKLHYKSKLGDVREIVWA